MLLNYYRLRVFASFVEDLATLSKCTKRKVAAISVNSSGTQVLSIGINGGPAGGVDCLCTLGTKYSCIHAEAQCIAKATSNDVDKIMICTLSPCITCAALIVNSGYEAMLYLEEWKDTDGIEIMKQAGLKVGKINQKEATIEWK